MLSFCYIRSVFDLMIMLLMRNKLMMMMMMMMMIINYGLKTFEREMCSDML